MIAEIEETLYIDLQAQIPASYCPSCGGARYGQDAVCLRCERRSHDTDGTE